MRGPWSVVVGREAVGGRGGEKGVAVRLGHTSSGSYTVLRLSIFLLLRHTYKAWVPVSKHNLTVRLGAKVEHLLTTHHKL